MKLVLCFLFFFSMTGFCQIHTPEQSTPIEEILDEKFIHALLSATTIVISQREPARSKTLRDPSSINLIKNILLDNSTYITGIKRSCQFVPNASLNIESVLAHTNYTINLSDIYCPKMLIEQGNERTYLELSEKGALKINSFINNPGGGANVDQLRVQFLILSYLIEKGDTDLIIALNQNKFFEVIQKMTRLGHNNFNCRIVLDNKSSVIFDELAKKSLIDPLQEKISIGEVKIARKQAGVY